jgi:hypothetical protein
MGPNFILDKGFLVDSAAANVAFGRACKFLAAGTGDKVTTSGAPATPAVSADYVVGIYQETPDAAKIATGKYTAPVRVMGISRAIAGGVVAKGDPVTSDANGKLVVVGVNAGVRWQVGIAWTAAAADGDTFDVLLTPGVTRNGGVT